jgi:hypothetical protein
MVKVRKTLDRYARRAMGNPVVKGITERIAGSKVVEHYESPHPKIIQIYTDNFYYFRTDPPHYRRFVIGKVRNKGKRTATNCWARISIDELGLAEIPLHWADESYNIRRNSMDMIELPPDVSRDLDIAFSVLGSEFEKIPSVSITGTVTGTTITGSEETSITDYGLTTQPSSTRGTFSPEVVGSDSNKLKRTLVESKERKVEPPLNGAWLASHLVIANPMVRSEHYLPPIEPVKRYRGKFEVICGNGEGNSLDMVLLVYSDPTKLDYDFRYVPT